MNSENTFNKPAFAYLLNKAKGNRSINKYADETNVSVSHISRLLRKLLDSPPTPETISKLASKADNGVTYKDLMIAAGYITGETVEVEYSPQDRQVAMKQIEENFFQIISTALYKESFQWSIHNIRNERFYPDMVICLEHQQYTRWFLEFKPSLDEDRAFLQMNLISLYGKIAMIELEATDKLSVVVNSPKEYENIIQNPPKSLRGNLFAMLIDLDERKIVKEEMICKY